MLVRVARLKGGYFLTLNYMSEDIRKMKGKRKITALTAYSYTTAKILSDAGIDLILVGDSLGMVVLGCEDTHCVTLVDIIRHGKGVMRGVVKGNQNALVVLDMPINTCEDPEKAVKNCQLALRETEAKAIKLEGCPESVKAVVDNGMAVLGHTGLKPQQVEKCKLTGKTPEEAEKVRAEAKAIEAAGAFAVVLECVPRELGKQITAELSIPTIGIGAGPDCDGQILVFHDMVGLYDDFNPKFVRRYANLRKEIRKATDDFMTDVKEGDFPSEAESY